MRCSSIWLCSMLPSLVKLTIVQGDEFGERYVCGNALIAGVSPMGNEEKVCEDLETMCLDGSQARRSVLSGLVHNFQNVKAFDAFKHMLTHYFK